MIHSRTVWNIFKKIHNHKKFLKVLFLEMLMVDAVKCRLSSFSGLVYFVFLQKMLGVFVYFKKSCLFLYNSVFFLKNTLFAHCILNRENSLLTDPELAEIVAKIQGSFFEHYWHIFRVQNSRAHFNRVIFSYFSCIFQQIVYRVDSCILSCIVYNSLG